MEKYATYHKCHLFLSYFIGRKDGAQAPPGNNHTYVISSDQLYYIDPSSDDVELVGNMANHLVGLAGLTYGSTRTAASTL